jgi:hypothetical protein
MANGYGYGGGYAWQAIGQELRALGQMLAQRQERDERQKYIEAQELAQERAAGAVPLEEAARRYPIENLEAIGNAAMTGVPIEFERPTAERTVHRGTPEEEKFTFAGAPPRMAPSGRNVLPGTSPEAALQMADYKTEAALDEYGRRKAIDAEQPGRLTGDLANMPPGWMPDSPEEVRRLAWIEEVGNRTGVIPGRKARTELTEARTQKLLSEFLEENRGTYTDFSKALKDVERQTAVWDSQRGDYRYEDDRGNELDIAARESMARSLMREFQSQPGPGAMREGYIPSVEPPISPEVGMNLPRGAPRDTADINVGGAVRDTTPVPTPVRDTTLAPDTTRSRLTTEQEEADARAGSKVRVPREDYEELTSFRP